MYRSGYVLMMVVLPIFLIGQKTWTKVNENSIQLRANDIREIIPQKYQTFELDVAQLTQKLATAPQEFSGSRTEVTIDLPMPNGEFKTFVVWASPVMEDELSAKYPSIKSYKGYQKDDRSVSTRFGVGPNGFHAAIKTNDGFVYIDPYTIGNQRHFITYYTSDHYDLSLQGRKLCGTTDEFQHSTTKQKWGKGSSRLGDKIEFRKYRLALGCTGEWGAVRGTKEKALAEMVIFVDRANVIFESEVALRAVIIGRNDELIFLDGAADPYEKPNEGLDLVGKNTGVLNGRIGSASYDIGHLFSICFDVGGVASGNICTSGRGAGVTCHNGSSVNNGIVLVFNHEVGHQMTASHTFNHCGDTDQLALGTAFEPGGGSTILAYPNACGTDNLPGVSRDDYYHSASLEQILSFTNSESSDAYICAEKIDINNHIPELKLDYKNGFNIPKSTPFFLTGSATDADGDNMTYVWEQFDNGSSYPLGAPLGNGPLFRSLQPQSNPTRFFPNISNLFGGKFSEKSELLPTYGRDLTFRFVVRDNNPLGNAAVWEEMKFKVAANAGPFVLTSPVLDAKYKIGKEVKVTWEVANTDIAPVNCKNVDIYISLNNSLDFNSENLILVSKETANDGSETIIIPNKTSNKARFVVKAHDNIFLTTSLYNSFIQTPETPAFFMDVAESIKSTCLPENVSYAFSSVGFAGLSEKIKWEVVSGLPDGAIATFQKSEINPGDTNLLNIDLSNASGTKDYQIVVRSYVEGVDTIERTMQLSVTGTDLSNIKLMSPANGVSGLAPTQKYEWLPKADATSYTLEVSKSPDFTPGNIVFTKTQQQNIFLSNNFLDKATIYYWRVRSSNDCNGGEWSEIFAFNTEALSCIVAKSGDIAINISSAGQSMIEAPITVAVDGAISDVNLKNIKAEHNWVGDLVAYLVSPSGKEVLLWNRKCGSVKSINIGIDDQSNDFFQCPINTGRIYRPESPLSAFNGESMKGKWVMRIEDKASGNGGKLLNFDIELCANLVLNPPVLTHNEVLNIHPKDQKNIDRVLLLSEDQNNTPLELSFTLVKAPSYGLLTLNGTPLNAGSRFTQDDIDKLGLKYIHTADNENEDGFTFTVTDGQGGWVSITEFVINVDSATPTATDETSFDGKILVYPNPANDFINIQLLDASSTLNQCLLMDITGRVLSSKSISETLTSIDIQDIKSGIYLLKLSNGTDTTFRKFVKK